MAKPLVVITGASCGIGAATALALAAGHPLRARRISCKPPQNVLIQEIGIASTRQER